MLLLTSLGNLSHLSSVEQNKANTFYRGVSQGEEVFPKQICICIPLPAEWCQQKMPSVEKTFWIMLTGPLDALTLSEV